MFCVFDETITAKPLDLSTGLSQCLNVEQAVLTTICRNEIGGLVHKYNNQWTVWFISKYP